MGSATAIWGYLALAVVIAGILLGAKNAGRNAERVASMTDTLKGVSQRNTIRDRVLSADEAERARLREKWSRK